MNVVKHDFKKGEKVIYDSITVLVTGPGLDPTLFAGVLIHQNDPKSHFTVGDYTRTWHGWLFKRIEKSEAKFISETAVTDPDSHSLVNLTIFKDQTSGSLFALDSSFLEQEDVDEIISPFNPPIVLEFVKF
jgi:hypothetical protein